VPKSLTVFDPPMGPHFSDAATVNWERLHLLFLLEVPLTRRKLLGGHLIFFFFFFALNLFIY
jgi:hypothetical protein